MSVEGLICSVPAAAPVTVRDAVRLVLPWLAVDAAGYAQAHAIGLLHALTLAPVADWCVTIFWLDFITYWQHRLLHANALLWRAHRVHHSDVALDALTAHARAN